MIHHIFWKAKEYNCLNKLANAISDAADINLKMSMERMGSDLLMELNTDFFYIKESIYNLDSDKLAVTLTITDPLNNYEKSNISPKIKRNDISEELKKTIVDTINLLSKQSSLPKDVLFIIAIQSFGREISLSINEKFKFSFLPITLESLSVISILEQDEILRIYKYTKYKEQFMDNVELIYCDELDLYYFYRSQKYQFRLPVGSEKAVILLRTNTGLPLKQEAFLRSRIHAVPSRYTNATVEVSSVNLDNNIPIYFCNVPKEVLNEYLGLVIEITSSRWIWVVPKEELKSDLESKYYFLVIDMLSYWIWQISSHIININQLPYKTINVQVSLNDLERWDDLHSNIEENVNTFYLSQSENNIYINIEKSFVALMNRADNLAEKKVMMHLLTAIADLFEIEDVYLDRDLLLKELEEVMIPSEKKKIILTNTSQSDLTPVGLLPSFRSVQSEDENNLRKEVSKFVKEKKLSLDQLSEKDNNRLLNDIVGFLYNTLENQVALLETSSLIDMLVLFNESAVKKRMINDLEIPATVACYSEGEKTLKQIEEEIEDLNKASVAIRFLIEYVAATPSQGTQSITLEMFDDLMAIASQVISYGQESDLIRYKLGKVEMLIEKNGEFHTELNNFTDTYSRFHYSVVTGEINQRTENFKYNWIESYDEINEKDDSESSIRDFKIGFIKEFGMNYNDFGQVAGMLLEISIRREVPIIRERVENLKRIAKESFGITEESFDRFVAIMTLTKRESFLKPKKPFNGYDVWPWRFNRELSYLRKPLILFDDVLLFSYNHLYSSLHYFIHAA